LEAKAVVVGPSLRGEVELAFFQAMRQRAGMVVGIDVQGFVRVLRGESLVYEPWDEMGGVLGCVDIVKSDAVEAEFLTGETDIYRAARRYASYGPTEIVLTHRDGVLIHANGRDHDYRFFPGSVIGRSGRGTVWAPMLPCVTQPPAEAGRWAALTSLKLEARPFDRTLAEVEAFWRALFRLNCG
jgi:sugar/nucleoside kinase (ribokinase family)